MRINVRTNAAEVSRSMRFLFRSQFPFATSLAINETAKDFQAEQRAGMEERFTIRRPFVLRGVRISKFSTKRDLSAHVEIDPSRSFLFKFEEGGLTRPRGTRFAIPDEVRRTKAGVVSRVLRPRALSFRRWGSGPKAEVFRGERRTFMIRTRGGRGVIAQRIGRRGRSRVRLLFTFSPTARIEPTLEFEETARTVVQDRFAQNFGAAFDRAVRTAR